jgi:molybdate transport system substrate-binding protein
MFRYQTKKEILKKSLPECLKQMHLKKISVVVTLFSNTLLVPTHSYAENITVFAAASLNNALTEIAHRYESSHPNDQIHTSFAASSTLARQIQLGAPAQIFISADEPWMNVLAKANLLIEKSRVDLLANQLVLITPKNQLFPVLMDKSFHLPLAFSGKICLGNPDSVPAGKYAKQSLIAMGWWEGLQSRVVPTEDVRSALAFVARGECPAGVVYTTDAMMSDKVKIIGIFPNNSHTPIVYPLALLKTTENQTKASTSSQQFWQYLQQPVAQKILHHYGFGAVKH